MINEWLMNYEYFKTIETLYLDELSIEKLEEQLDTLKQNFKEKEGLVEDLKESNNSFSNCLN